jgi:hypothetical protein
MSDTAESLIPSTFLFHFLAPLREKPKLFQGKLGPRYELPALSALSSEESFTRVRAAWSRQGLRFQFHVTGRGAPLPDYHESVADFEGVWLWLDTRATHTVHRATKFCHLFNVFIHGREKGESGPIMVRSPIHRAREQPAAEAPDAFTASLRPGKARYVVDVHIPAKSLVGFDANEHRELGFFYAVRDSELGWNYWTSARQLPFAEDPSVWSTLEML